MRVLGRIEQPDDSSKGKVSKGTELPSDGQDGDFFTLLAPGADLLYVRKDGSWLQIVVADEQGKVPAAHLNCVTSLGGKHGDVSLSSQDVLDALGYTPYDASNPQGFAPGVVLQVVNSSVAAQSGTTTVPLNNKSPTPSTGAQIWAQDITLASRASKVRLTGAIMVDSGSSAREAIACVFRNNVCIAVVSNYVTTSNRAVPIPFNIWDAPDTTQTITYSIRFGLHSSATWYVNRTTTLYFNGLYAANGLTLMEFA